MFYVSALILGLTGSLHCAGMCGPLMLALSTQGEAKRTRMLWLLWYHLGRILVYASLGLLAGSIGKGLFIAGFQQWTSIVAGIIIVASVMLPKRILYKIPFLKPGCSTVPGVQKAFGKVMKMQSRWSYILLGMLNGLLPCGLVYVAMANSVASGSLEGGALAMALFGLGTTPALVGIALLGRSPLRKAITPYIPAFAGLAGILLIVRGLGLGIPGVSPSIVVHQDKDGVVKQQMDCCHKGAKCTK